MKTLIVYATTHGCTEKCVELLKSGMTGETEIMNLKNKASVRINDFNMILIGGSIHAGMIQGSVKKFCKKNLQTLLSKKIGLFICCGFDGEKAREQFNNAYPPDLREHATVHGFFGHAFDFDRINFILKAFIKKASDVDKSVNNINEKAIQEFIEKISG